MRAFVEVAPRLAGGGKFRVRHLVAEQHAVAIHDDVRHESTRLHQRKSLLADSRRLRLRGDGQIERLVGSLDVLSEVNMRNVERVAVVVKTMGGAVGRKIARQSKARQVEQITHRILILGARQPPEAGAPFTAELFQFCADQRGAQPLRHRRGLLCRRTRLLFWRHLARIDTIINLHPAREGIWVGQVRLERI